jgi:(E)-4-hydroxy-3-methylbut-2-enyl-diphosphate synthase
MVDLISLAGAVEKALTDIEKPLKVAVMGCAVNGPGEGREADIGVACGNGDGLLFQGGKILYKVPYDQIVPAIRAWRKTLQRKTDHDHAPAEHL